MDANKNSDVYLIKTKDRKQGINKLLERFNLKQFSGKKVAVKANFNSADPFPASTHIQTLKTLMERLQAAGSSQLVMAERSGMRTTREVLEKMGIYKLSRELGFKVVVLDKAERGMD